MAKATIEAALLDFRLRERNESLAHFLGATQQRVASGVSVGIQPSIDELIRVVDGYVREGYKRIKLKIEPGWDIEPVQAIRSTFGDGLLMQVDANAAYTLDDAQHLARLDEYRLLLIEQPLPEEDVVGVASTLTRRGYSEYRAVLPVTWRLDDHSVTVRARWASDIISSSGATTYSGPITWDLNYAYSLTDTARMSLFVNNVSNKLPSTTVGYFPSAQRQAGLQFQYEF